jgi:N-acetylmuramoyl-L-alanine amidase
MTREHLVKSGDCIASIAFANGFFPDTLWQDPANRDLRERRPSPNHLLDGDVVHVPALREKEVVCATGKRHRFRRRGVPEKFRVQLKVDGVPRRAVEYVFVVGGAERAGVTDGEGWVDQWIPPDAEEAVLRIVNGTTREEYRIKLGTVAPLASAAGVAARLRNLGFLHERDTDAAVRVALRKFQARCGLAPTGDLDDQTRAKLGEAHQ